MRAYLESQGSDTAASATSAASATGSTLAVTA